MLITRRYYRKHVLIRFFTVFASVFASYCMMYVFFGSYFMTNDDTSIMKAISGYKLGTPTSYHVFLSTPLGLMFKQLYTWLPNLPWYPVFHICSAVLCISVVLFFTPGGKALQKRSQKVYYAVLTCVLIAAACVFPFHEIAWTVTSAFYGIASVMFMLELRKHDIDKKFYLLYSLSMIMLALSQIVRHSSYVSQLPFFFLTFAFAVYQCRKRWNKKCKILIILTTVILVSMISSISTIDTYYKDHVVESETYLELKQYRGQFSDYPVIPYKGNEEFYGSMGWDEEFYNVSRNWMYMDRRFTSENLKKIVEKTAETKHTDSFSEKAKKTVEHFIHPVEDSDFVRSNQVVSIVIGLLTVAGMIFSLYFWKKKNRYLMHMLFVTGVNLVSVAEITYQCYLQRFLPRTFLCSALPAICIDCYFFMRLLPRMMEKIKYYSIEISLHSQEPKKGGNKKFGCRVSSLVLSVCMLFGIGVMLEMMSIAFDKDILEIHAKYDMQVYLCEQYCAKHPDQFFVKDRAVSNDFKLFPHMKELRGCRKNIMFYGGSEVLSKGYSEQLKANGYDEFYSENLLDENVYFISWNNNLDESVFAVYMRKAHGKDVHCHMTEVITDNVYVYKFTRAEKEKQTKKETKNKTKKDTKKPKKKS